MCPELVRAGGFRPEVSDSMAGKVHISRKVSTWLKVVRLIRYERQQRDNLILWVLIHIFLINPWLKRCNTIRKQSRCNKI
jgi:hypothetical protein